jgi:hypothetical protein
MKKILTTVLGIAFVMSFTLMSCGSKEEKLYGKIDVKTKEEKTLIQEVQNTVFSINTNLTLKDAVASNVFSNNIVWKLFPAEKKGAYFVTFEYDIKPIELAMSTDIYDEDTADRVFYVIINGWPTLSRSWYKDVDGKRDIVSPIGYANMFTRFISAEGFNPHGPGSDKEMEEVLAAYNEYRKPYEGSTAFIPYDQVPDQLPEPFFKITAIKFIGECYAELSSDDVAFTAFTILFDFTLPYLDNKEYKGYGLTCDQEGIPAINNWRKEDIKAEDGLSFVYEDKKIFDFYPHLDDPLSLSNVNYKDFQ